MDSKSDFRNPGIRWPALRWIDDRLPVFSMMRKEYAEYPVPKNFNYFWNFGALATVMLIFMILTGLWLSMFYVSSTAQAFASVERIMRDVNFGWLIRYLHMNGASMFFAVVYIHIFRGLYYGSFKKPRELLWMLGVVILLLMMAAAFLGYTLPWGQMSYWGATVITNMFTAIPVIGEPLQTWLIGGFAVGDATLNRFFSLHYLVPFLIVGVVFAHVAALHVTGSNNPTGIEPRGPRDTVSFHPYYTVKDTFGLGVFLMIYVLITFWFPNMLGHEINYIEGDPLVTPPHIVPEWYFLPLYAILRAIPDKLMGVIAMNGAVLILFLLPWLDTHPVRSGRYRPLFKLFTLLFVANAFMLGVCGANPPEGVYVPLARIGTVYWFGYFLVILPLLSRYEKARPLPESIHASVLAEKGGEGAAGARSTGRAAALAALALAGLALLGPGPAMAAGEQREPPDLRWQHEGFFGSYDRAAAQRGWKVYDQVCASCHGMKFLHYRNLADIGFTEAEIKAIAAEKQVTDGPDDRGEMFKRPGLPRDEFVSPYPNDNAAAAANGGVVPPDLSLIVKAREGGADYLHALLASDAYVKQITAPDEVAIPEDIELRPGQYYNPYMAGQVIKMPPPLISEGLVSYDSELNPGVTPTIDRMARDVTVFLAWAAEPHLEDRKRMGIKVMLFLLVFTGVMYAANRQLWRKVKAH